MLIEKPKASITLADLFLVAWLGHWDKPRFRGTRHSAEVSKLWAKHLAPNFGRYQFDEVPYSEIRKWHREMWETPYAANRALEVLSRIYSYAEEEGVIPKGSNPCAGMKGHPEKKRRRFASEAEMRKIGQLLKDNEERRPLQVAFVYLVALTGARPESVFKLHSGQLDRRGDVAVVHFSGKESEDSGEQEMLVLPKSVLDLLDKLPLRDDGLLLGEVKYRGFWDRIRKEAGCPDLWLRDLRRTYGSMGLSDGVSLDLIGELLNHKSTQTTKGYAKLFSAARINAAVKISNRIGDLMGVKHG